MTLEHSTSSVGVGRNEFVAKTIADSTSGDHPVRPIDVKDMPVQIMEDTQVKLHDGGVAARDDVILDLIRKSLSGD